MLQNKTFKNILIEQKSLITLLVLIAIVSCSNDNFFTLNNFFNILQQTSINAVIAVGMTLVILTSGIDLSVGSIFALTGAIAASIIGVDISPFIAIFVSLALGWLLGDFSGIIIAKGKLQAFIATLVMMLILRGITQVYTKGSPISTGSNDNSELFEWVAFGRVLGIPVPILIMIIVFICNSLYLI
jgi:ribose transport system permease protein